MSEVKTMNDLRRFLIDTMKKVKSGELEYAKGAVIVDLADQVIGSLKAQATLEIPPHLDITEIKDEIKSVDNADVTIPPTPIYVRDYVYDDSSKGKSNE